MSYLFIKEYTDCQLRLGLLKWLLCFIPSSGRGQADTTILDIFEKNLYQISSTKSDKTLLNKYLSSGSYKIKFEARDLPSGIYIYRIDTGKFQQTKKMILLK